jgi:3-hydroxybutyrate dehydrogenase
MYCASKAAISSFCRSLGYLEPEFGIRVNAVAPGVVKTPIWTQDKLRLVDEEKGSFTFLFPVSLSWCEE